VTPTLILVNSTDPEEDAVRYDFEVYEADSLVARIDSVREGEGGTAWSVSPRLEEGKTYRWRTRARDAELASDWSSLESFLVNASNRAPSAPILFAPPEGSLVALPVVLEVMNAVDPDGDALTYRFEVYEDENLTILVEDSGEVPETSERTFWQVTDALDENHLYYWRAGAFDGSLASAWMPTARFRFSLQNDAPAPPRLVTPEDGATIEELRPTFTIENSVDPDGDSVRYVFEVYIDAALVVRSREIEAGDPRTSWQVTQDLEENEIYSWLAIATDGAATTPSENLSSFRVNAVEEAPSAPLPLSPVNGSTIASRTPTLVVRNAGSPDGRPLRYHFEVFLEGGALVASEENVPEVASETSFEVSPELTPGLTYSWRARALDDRGLASAWSELFSFTVLSPTTECPPEWREDFEGPIPGWRLRREIGNPLFEVDSGELESRFEGRGAFLFEGTGVPRMAQLRAQGELDRGDDGPSNCGFRAGVVFYSTASGEYRLDVSGPGCREPRARLLKVRGESELVLDERALDDDTEEVRFRIEVLNGIGATEIRAELEGDDEHLVLEAFDDLEPLRSGTLGAWSSFVEAEWDDMRVSEVPGFESGISGDENGDGVCDAESACVGPFEVCLDGGGASVTASGSAGHSGPTACGAQHSYWVGKKTGVLSVDAGAFAEAVSLPAPAPSWGARRRRRGPCRARGRLQL
jgi:hypothetical protein